MIDKDDRLPKYSKEHGAMLNVLQQRKEFPALLALFRLEESNLKEIIAKNIPVSGEFSDEVKQKLSIYRGRIEELRILIAIFDLVKKKDKNGTED
jgi:hypothetical protein